MRGSSAAGVARPGEGGVLMIASVAGRGAARARVAGSDIRARRAERATAKGTAVVCSNFVLRSEIFF